MVWSRALRPDDAKQDTVVYGTKFGVVFLAEGTGLWTAGCWLARRLHQLKASTTMDLGISFFLFLYNVWP